MNEEKSEEQIMKELDELRGRIAELESLESEHRVTAGADLDERYYQALVENSYDVIAVLDSDGTARYISPSGERLTGFTPEEITGKNLLDFAHHDDLPRVVEALKEEVEAPGVTVQLEYRMKHKDGSWRHLEVVGTNLLDEGPVYGIVANVRDITESRRVEEALRDSDERYRRLIENLNDAVFNLDIEGVVTYISPAVERIAGFSVEDIQGKPLADFVHNEDLPGLMENLQGAVAGRLEPYEFRMPDRQGGVHYVEISSRPMKKGGEVTGLTGVMSEITERKQADEARRHQEEDFRAQIRNRITYYRKPGER